MKMKVILPWIIVGLLVILFYSVLFFMIGCFVPAQDRGPAGFDAQGNAVEKPTYVAPKQRVKKKAVKYWPKYKITFYRGTSGFAGLWRVGSFAGLCAPDERIYYTDSYEMLNDGVKFIDSDKVERFISGQYEIRPYDDYIYIWVTQNAD